MLKTILFIPTNTLPSLVKMIKQAGFPFYGTMGERLPQPEKTLKYPGYKCKSLCKQRTFFQNNFSPVKILLAATEKYWRRSSLNYAFFEFLQKRLISSAPFIY